MVFEPADEPFSKRPCQHLLADLDGLVHADQDRLGARLPFGTRHVMGGGDSCVLKESPADAGSSDMT